MYTRTLNLKKLLEKKSHFLLGPRGTGKTTLVKNQLSEYPYNALVITLLNSDYFLRLSARPAELESIIRVDPKAIVVIDEVQKLPILLDEVHRLIEDQKRTFLLTGSSARKLKRGGANLLAGRAWTANLFSLTSREIVDFDLERYLSVGGLPSVYLSSYPHEELKSYVSTYLIEEISAEGLVRDLPLFSRFLQKAALTCGELLNFSEIASDLGVSPTTAREYYRILEDTLIGFMVEPLRNSQSRKEVSTAKFYLFDIGITNALRQISVLQEGPDYYGKVFEQFIALELRAALSYCNSDYKLQFWRTQTQQEVDFIIGDILAIEVKSTKNATIRMAKGLKRISETYSFKHRILLSRDLVERIENGIHFMHYKVFLERLWNGDYFAAAE